MTYHVQLTAMTLTRQSAVQSGRFCKRECRGGGGGGKTRSSDVMHTDERQR